MRFSFPVSLDVTDRRCLVVGGGDLAYERALALLDAGAHVVVLSDEIVPAVEELVRAGRVGVVRRVATPEDLEGAFVAIATREDGSDPAALWEAAEARGVLFTAADDVAHCHFAMPSVLRRGDLRITVSTSGRAPALAKRLRTWLADRIGPEYGRLVDTLADARTQALPRTEPFDAWAARWAVAVEPLEQLAARVAAGESDEVRAEVVATITGRPADQDLEVSA